jgi:hypothetical protein
MVIAWGGQKLPESVVNMEYAILIAFKDGNCRNSILTQKRQLLGRGTTWSYKYTPWGDIINTSQYITIHHNTSQHTRDQIQYWSTRSRSQERRT